MAVMSLEQSVRASLSTMVGGGLVSLFLSGIVMMQVYLYIRVYSNDRLRVKVMVGLIWGMDFLHSIMICIAIWSTLVSRFGDYDKMDYITWSVGMTVALTALVTFFVHCFFIHRIYLVSSGNKWLTYPLAVLALFRLVAASVSTSKMIILASYSKFVAKYAYVFTMGLSSAAALDAMITAGMCYYLRRSKSGMSTMNKLLDTLILYTVETGGTTCVVTIATLACWVSMPQNLVFLGIHFTISKLYANSFMAILNSRVTLNAARTHMSAGSGQNRHLPVLLSNLGGSRKSTSEGPTATSQSSKLPLQISVHKTVRTDIDIGERNEEGILDSPYIQHMERADQDIVDQVFYEGKGEDWKTVGRR